MAALARPKDTRPVAHTTGFQYSLSVGGLVLPVFNPPAFSWWLLSKQLDWKLIQVRTTERGYLCERFAARRVWTVYEGTAVEEWLVVREEADGKYRYALCNASSDTPLERLAGWKCQRYFIERANQDAKSEFGWDELQARKYRAGEHHLAMTILAAWFIA